MEHKLKYKLIENSWTVYNDTDLPIACFSGHHLLKTQTSGNKITIRAGITTYATTEENLDKLIASLNKEIKNI